VNKKNVLLLSTFILSFDLEKEFCYIIEALERDLTFLMERIWPFEMQELMVI